MALPKALLRALLRSKAEYQQLFDPKVFLRKKFTPLPSGEISDEEYQAWYLQVYHQFFSLIRGERDPETVRMLEFAGGPSVFSLISAAPCVKEIVFSEFLDTNRAELQLWLDKSKDGFDWKPFFRHVLEKLEKQEASDGAISAREDLVRSKISCVVPCDIMKDPVVSAEGLFDVVSCSNVLGPVSNSLEEYHQNVKKLAALLKLGGYLVVVQSWDGSFYGVGKQNFHSLRITDAEFEEAIKAAGLTATVYKKKGAPAVVRDIPGNRKGMLFVSGKKGN